MLADLRRHGPVVSLVPQTGVQFLDAGFDHRLMKISRPFVNRPHPTRDNRLHLVALELHRATAADGAPREGFTDLDGNPVEVAPEPGEDVGQVYTLTAARALEALAGRWLPLPLLRITDTDLNGVHRFAPGPGNWARVMVAALDQPDLMGNTHRVVVAFDTALLPQRERRPYLAPSPDDARSGQEFALAHDVRDISWWLDQEWVDEWLHELYLDHLRARRAPRRLNEEDVVNKCGHWALYLTLLDVLHTAGALPRIRFIDTLSAELAPGGAAQEAIPVDLVLDVGNSRCYGLLIEAASDDQIDLNDSYALALRDLDQPWRIHRDPFPSRLEFARATFGNDRLSRRSGRTDAFLWPTVTRVGFQAQRLSYAAQGTEGASGLSSPKRYLWDREPRRHEWHFTASQAGPAQAVIAGGFVQNFREDGEERQPADPPPTSARFSRSSLMVFFLCEVLLHAFMQINAPHSRYERAHSEVPRRLRRIIMTMPAAMPVAERRILEKRATAAARLAWKALGREAGETPRVELRWDEATGTQVVYLYNELKRTYLGDPDLFFQVAGRPRPPHGERPCLRIASLDIGGGTTDLIITSYLLEGREIIRPVQEFREGFNLAGDDLLAAVIERHVLTTLHKAVAAAGVREPGLLLAMAFGENRGGQSELARTLRQQFANQVLMPLGLRLMRFLESWDPLSGDQIQDIALEDLFSGPESPTPRVVAYLEDMVREAGGQGFSLRALSVEANAQALDATVRRVLGPLLAPLCEILFQYDCDALLLSGRPSRMPSLRSAILARLPLIGDRCIQMSRYRVGAWYPYRDGYGQLSDPKTTAAVGAMVCTLSEGQLEGFHLRSRELRLRSTARYIGVMTQTGQVRGPDVLFADADLDDRAARLPEAAFPLSAPLFIGFRQLGVDRWPATPLYRATLGRGVNPGRLALPLAVSIGRTNPDDPDGDEDFRVVGVDDAEGTPLAPTTVALSLQTLKNDDGYWLDTGVFDTPK